ncbi:MAG: hypothetical protein RLZZ501_2512 [Pseudomonadota bacterium]
MSRALAAAGLAAAALGTGAAALAAEPPLAIDLSRHLVEITTGFSGTDLLLFGAVEPVRGDADPDVVVVVRGPNLRETIRRKQPVAGFWITTGSARAVEVPGFYRVAATRPLEEIAPPALRDRLGLGVERLPLPVTPADPEADPAPYRAALLRLMAARGLIDDRVGTVALPGQRLFRADVHFPATVPVGLYKVEVHLISHGRLIASRETPLAVDRVGLGAAIHRFAHQQAGLYGLGAVVLAAFAGWLAAWVFRKG